MLLVLVQPSPASCATCRGTSALPRVLALTHRHLHKSPCVRQPFAEISGNTVSSSPVVPLPETVPIFVCQFKGSLHWHSCVPDGATRCKAICSAVLCQQRRLRSYCRKRGGSFPPTDSVRWTLCSPLCQNRLYSIRLETGRQVRDEPTVRTLACPAPLTIPFRRAATVGRSVVPKHERL